MITARLQGGLGNQMFQIAAAHALALRNGVESKFNLNSCQTPNQGNTSPKYADTIFKNINTTDEINLLHIYNEPKFSYDEIPYQENLMITGIFGFQSEKYFEDFKDEIHELFHISLNDIAKVGTETPELRIGKDKPITAVHIRRGDYVKNPQFHSLCDKEYYERAMAEIGDSNFIFVSDDMGWVKENFKGVNILYSPFTDEVMDLTLMKICDNVIISNSSFSWWGAYLNRNVNKKVIGPKKWFGESGPKDQQDVIPENWIKL